MRSNNFLILLSIFYEVKDRFYNFVVSWQTLVSFCFFKSHEISLSKTIKELIVHSIAGAAELTANNEKKRKRQIFNLQDFSRGFVPRVI